MFIRILLSLYIIINSRQKTVANDDFSYSHPEIYKEEVFQVTRLQKSVAKLRHKYYSERTELFEKLYPVIGDFFNA